MASNQAVRLGQLRRFVSLKLKTLFRLLTHALHYCVHISELVRCGRKLRSMKDSLSMEKMTSQVIEDAPDLFGLSRHIHEFTFESPQLMKPNDYEDIPADQKRTFCFELMEVTISCGLRLEDDGLNLEQIRDILLLFAGHTRLLFRKYGKPSE